MTEDKKQAEEALRFSDNGDSHVLPPLSNWYSNEILRPNLRINTGVLSFQDLVIDEVKTLRLRNPKVILVSIGAGHGQIESELVKRIAEESPGDTEAFSLDLFSPNDMKIYEDTKNTYRLTRAAFDANTDEIPRDANIIIVHHALHHFTALEEIFKRVHQILRANSGTFVIADMVGRNGHMRWPESLHAIRRIWSGMAPDKKIHNQLNRPWEDFENWDCSGEGFEGVRSEDILIFLFKYFEIDKSFFWGGIIDPFIERGFADNFDPQDQSDIDFISKVQKVESQLTDLGIVTPTQVIGAFRPRNIPLVNSVTNFFGSKKYNTTLNHEAAGVIDAVVDQHFKFPKLKLYVIQKNINYNNSEISHFNHYGWDYSDLDRCWGFGLESKIAFNLEGEKLSQIRISSVILDSSLNGYLNVEINNEIRIVQSFSSEIIIYIPPISIFEVEIRITFSKVEKLENSSDKRLITFFIQSLTLV